MNGWNVKTLQAAVEQCTNPSGLTSDCPVFNNKLQSEPEMAQCKIQDLPKMLANDNCAGPAKGLCGDVPVQYGPGYAAPLKPGNGNNEPTAKPILSSVAPVPTQSYAPARSQGAGGISVFNVKPSVYVADVPAPSPAVTPAPAASSSAQDGSIVRTTTYTSAGVVYEVAIKEVIEYVTLPESSNKARRHAHVHARRDREHGLLRHA